MPEVVVGSEADEAASNAFWALYMRCTTRLVLFGRSREV